QGDAGSLRAREEERPRRRRRHHRPLGPRAHAPGGALEALKDRTGLLEPSERASLEARLGHCFTDGTLLEQALTHASFAHEQVPGPLPDYDRLEFLGDAVLGLLLAEHEFLAETNAGSGEMSQR